MTPMIYLLFAVLLTLLVWFTSLIRKNNAQFWAEMNNSPSPATGPLPEKRGLRLDELSARRGEIHGAEHRRPQVKHRRH